MTFYSSSLLSSSTRELDRTRRTRDALIVRQESESRFLAMLPIEHLLPFTPARAEWRGGRMGRAGKHGYFFRWESVLYPGSE